MSETIIVNANTVARAYRDLEREGFVTCQRGIGTRVSATGSPLSEEEQMKVLNDRASALLSEAGQMELSLDDVVRLVTNCAEKMNFPTKEPDK